MTLDDAAWRRFWRIEHPADGYGPYWGGAFHPNALSDWTYRAGAEPPKHDPRQPMIEEDFSDRVRAEYAMYKDRWKAAFATLAQFRQWVYKPEWRTDLDRAGFRLYHFRAKGIVGPTQALYCTATRTDDEERAIPQWVDQITVGRYSCPPI